MTIDTNLCRDTIKAIQKEHMKVIRVKHLFIQQIFR